MSKSLSERMLHVRQLLTDPEFLELDRRVRSVGLLAVLGQTYIERWHSAFFAWLLNPDGSHGLGDFPMRRLMVWMASQEIASDDAHRLMPSPALLERADLDVLRIRPNPANQKTTGEQSVSLGHSSARKKAKFDVFAAMEVRDSSVSSDLAPCEKVIFICEVKVKAGEGADQTPDYAEWALAPEYEQARRDFFKNTEEAVEESAKNGTEAEGTVRTALLFLRPDEKTKPSADQFVSMTYQTMVDEVLAVCLQHPHLSTEGSVLIEAFVNNLATPYTDAVSGRWAVIPAELRSVEEIFRHHEETLLDLVQAASLHREREADAPEPPAEPPKRKNYRVKLTDLVREEIINSEATLEYRRVQVQRQVKLATTSEGLTGIRVGDEVYKTPSAAAKAIYGSVCRGWDRFFVVDPATGATGPSLMDLRDKLEPVMDKQPAAQEEDPVFAEYAYAVLQSHEQVFRLIEAVRQSGEEDFSMPAYFRKRSTGRSQIDWSELLDSYDHDKDGKVELIFRDDSNITAILDLGLLQFTVQGEGGPVGVSGAVATRFAAEKVGKANASGSYRWSSWWRVREAGDSPAPLVQDLLG